MNVSGWKQPRFLAWVLVAQAIAIITIVFDIAFARQVIGFLYLAFIPGFVILMGFRQDKFNITETILLSVGLSITFLMFVGLLINELGPLIFISNPLSTLPLATVIIISVLLITIFSCLRRKENFHLVLPQDLRMFYLIPFFAIAFLGVIGVMLVNAFKSNFLLIFVIITIAISFVIISLFKSSFYYPLLISIISSTLLLLTFLTSNYLNGFDIHSDFFVFNITSIGSYWNKSFGRDLFFNTSWQMYLFNSMLSVTVLPTIFSNLLNINGTWMFKIIYPLIFSLVPLALFQIQIRQWGKKVAFISILFFMSNSVFFNFQNTVKEMVAELFYVLLFLILFKKDINQGSRWILIIFFSFSLIVSYYTMAYFFLVMIFSAWIFAKVFSKNKNISIDLTVLLFFTVFIFTWYIFIVNPAFYRFQGFITGTYQSLITEFFSPQSRGQEVLVATGMLSSPTLLHQIGKIFFNITALFILIGFIIIIARKKKDNFDPQYFVLISTNLVLLLMSIIIPNFSASLQIDRLYHVALLFISPLFIVGGRSIFDNILKIFRLKENKREIYGLVLVLLVLVTFFFFQTGFIYEIEQDPVPSSVFLSKYRMAGDELLNLGYINENDFFGAIWLSKYVDVNAGIYSDVKSKFHVLTSSMIDTNNRIDVIGNTTVFNDRSYVYLNEYNTKNGIIIRDTRYPFNIRYNISEIPILNSTMIPNNKIYSNDACEIHYIAP